jgi:hypothetical protein
MDKNIAQMKEDILKLEKDIAQIKLGNPPEPVL